MKIPLLFVLAFATFGNCKKFHAKSAGYLFHNKSGTYVKIKKSPRKLKVNLTTHKIEPKQQGSDYDDIDDLDTPAKKEKWLEDMWNEAWEHFEAEGEGRGEGKAKTGPKQPGGKMDARVGHLSGCHSWSSFH